MAPKLFVDIGLGNWLWPSVKPLPGCNTSLFLTGNVEINLSEILIEVQSFSWHKMHLKVKNFSHIIQASKS